MPNILDTKSRTCTNQTYCCKENREKHNVHMELKRVPSKRGPPHLRVACFISIEFKEYANSMRHVFAVLYVKKNNNKKR